MSKSNITGSFEWTEEAEKAAKNRTASSETFGQATEPGQGSGDALVEPRNEDFRNCPYLDVHSGPESGQEPRPYSESPRNSE
jgi:hypothetical protein